MVNTKLLHFHYDSPDDSDHEYYLIISNGQENPTARIEELEYRYKATTALDDQTRYDMADYVVQHLREAGFTLVWIGSGDVIRREYESDYA